MSVVAWSDIISGGVPGLGHGIFALRTDMSAGPALMMLVMLAAHCLTRILVYGALGERPCGLTPLHHEVAADLGAIRTLAGAAFEKPP